MEIEKKLHNNLLVAIVIGVIGRDIFGMQLGGKQEEEGEGQKEKKKEGGREEGRREEDTLNYNLQR